MSEKLTGFRPTRRTCETRTTCEGGRRITQAFRFLGVMCTPEHPGACLLASKYHACHANTTPATPKAYSCITYHLSLKPLGCWGSGGATSGLNLVSNAHPRAPQGPGRMRKQARAASAASGGCTNGSQRTPRAALELELELKLELKLELELKVGFPVDQTPITLISYFLQLPTRK